MGRNAKYRTATYAIACAFAFWAPALYGAEATIDVSVTPNPVLLGQQPTVNVVTTGCGDCSYVTGSVELQIDHSTYGHPIVALDTGDGTHDGTATFVIPTDLVGTYLTPGPHSIGVVYSGDDSYSAAISNQVVLNVVEHSTTAISASPNPAVLGQAVTYTATVSPGATGAVDFFDGSVQINSTPVPISGGVAQFTTTAGPLGKHSISATYRGDSTFLSSSSSVLTVSVFVSAPQAKVTLSSNANPSTIGQPVTFTALLSVVVGDTLPTGSIQFSDGATVLGTVATVSQQASLTTSSLTLGSHSILAKYSGDSVYPATSVSIGQFVNKLTSLLTLTASPASPLTGQSVTLTATIGPAPPANVSAATGQVTFSEGGNVLGTAALASGAASLALGSLTEGAHQIDAAYGGDRNWLATRASLKVTVLRGALQVSGSLPDGVLGSPYSAKLSAIGGTGQYQFAASGLPDGLTADSTGAITGTPQASGDFSVSVQVTDSNGATASGTLTLHIVVGPLTITTNSLPDGTATVDYSTKLAASGGVPPYQWALLGTPPEGISLAPDGTLSGNPPKPGSFDLTVRVTDSKGAAISKVLTLHVGTAPLSIGPATLPGGTTGSPYSATVKAVGGTSTGYTYSGSLPSGLTIDAATGVISGTPAILGSTTLTVSVKDSAGATASRTYTVVFSLPAVSTLNFGGVNDTANPQAQPGLQLTLNTKFPVAISGTLTLTFQADQGGDDPAVQFSKSDCPPNTRCINFTIPANSDTATFPSSSNLALQTGTVAGLITITANLQAGGTDITPTPPPTRQIRINPAPPTISVTATRTAAGFTVVVSGFSTTREVTQATFHFNAATGANLQTTDLTIPAASLFSSWYQSDVARPFGGQFLYTQLFTVQGDTQAIVSVTVTLTNSRGSAQGTATIQ